MERSDLKLVVGVGQGAILCVFAAADLDKVLAVFPLVVVDVVDLLNEIVGVFTVRVWTNTFFRTKNFTVEHVVQRTAGL